jgi:glycosyltransferase involved in cell wall biosynthesis
VLVGSALFDTDTYARALKREVAQAGLADRVIFAGFREDTPQVLAALDIFAHTALEKDSSPLAVVSAMASGKPIVCSAVDGTVQLFRDGEDGLVFPPGDADVLAEHLATLLNDPGLRRRLGQAARVKADQELSAEPYARRCESVFQRALRQ